MRPYRQPAPRRVTQSILGCSLLLACSGGDPSTERLADVPSHPDSFVCRGRTARVLSTSCTFSTLAGGDEERWATEVGALANLGTGGSANVQTIVTVSFLGTELGEQRTAYGGTMLYPGAEVDPPEVSVTLGGARLSSAYSTNSCTVELTEIARGERIAAEVAGEATTIERGSRVRMQIDCPYAGLWSLAEPGYGYGGTSARTLSGPFGPARHKFSPYEFELEAFDCEVVDEPTSE